ncbi:hypothetical protein ACG33_15020 [Steroidobacter denitrificans]|uniref:Bcr/CflA family efflux transporter n=2 Tax=Steroidobacter denitrificans TaxID=465721 RepID=A0A127FEP5_STEDE|nr:hypothetical protein ACG33_15020 [Steroidobacter denitrificans]
MSVVGPVSIDMYLPGFPQIERDFAQRGVEVTMAAYMIGIAIGQLFYGPLSDRFGRKSPLYVGFALYTIGSLGCVFATSLTILTGTRVLQALGGCAGMVIGRAIVRDRCEPHEAARAFSTLMMIVALGPVIAPALGGIFVTTLGWRSTFVFQAVFGMALMFAMHRVLTDARPASADAVRPRKLSIAYSLRRYLYLLRDGTFLGYSLLGGFAMSGLFAYIAGAPTVLPQHYGLSAQQFGWLIGLNGLTFMLASRLNIRALRKYGPAEAVARHVWLPLGLSLALLLSATLMEPPLVLLLALQLSYFVGVGRVTPHAAALAMAPHGQDAGAASGLMGALHSLVAMIVSMVVAAVNDGTVLTLAVIMAAAAVCSVLSYVWIRHRGRSAG